MAEKKVVATITITVHDDHTLTFNGPTDPVQFFGLIEVARMHYWRHFLKLTSSGQGAAGDGGRA